MTAGGELSAWGSGYFESFGKTAPNSGGLRPPGATAETTKTPRAQSDASPSEGEPFNQVLGQPDRAHLLLGGFDVVLHAIEFDPRPVLIPNGKAGPDVAIPGLPDGPRINEQFLSGLTSRP